MDWREILGALAVAISFASMVPYILSTLKGVTKPHIFSWFLWGIFNLIAGIAQAVDHGGPGAWINFAGAASCWLGAYLGYRKGGVRDIARSDWYAFAGALVAIVP